LVIIFVVFFRVLQVMSAGSKGPVAADLQRQYLLDMLNPQAQISQQSSSSWKSSTTSSNHAAGMPLPLPLPKELSGMLANKDSLPPELRQQYLLEMLKPANLAALRSQQPP